MTKKSSVLLFDLFTFEGIAFDLLVFDVVVFDLLVFEGIVFNLLVYDVVVFDLLVSDVIVFDLLVSDVVVFDLLVFDVIALPVCLSPLHFYRFVFFSRSRRRIIFGRKRKVVLDPNSLIFLISFRLTKILFSSFFF